jgi:predicted O-methyltransferase YrrM
MLHALLDRLFYLRARFAFDRATQTQSAMEVIYKDLFTRDLERHGDVDDFYAVGSAANYGLLYLIQRIARELKPATIVELGAGQSTRLIDRINRRAETPATITTVEHDPHWAGLIGAQVQHKLTVVPLVKSRIAGHEIDGYDLSSVTATAINLLIIDGPIAKGHGTRFNRWGALPLIERLADDFVVIVDDAERPGDRDHGRAIIRRLRSAGRELHVGGVTSNKRQIVIAGGAFAAAAYY